MLDRAGLGRQRFSWTRDLPPVFLLFDESPSRILVSTDKSGNNVLEIATRSMAWHDWRYNEESRLAIETNHDRC